MADQIWQVSIVFTEEGDRTRADAMLELADDHYHGYGGAKKAPGDPTVPVIGQDLAAARALSDLSHQLLSAAAERIEEREGHTVKVHD
jgi:hypothetical protein